jgi:hypothetical protein
MQTGYADLGGRWRGRAEAKSLENGWFFNLYFIHGTSQYTVAKIFIVQVVGTTSYIPTYDTT